MSEVESTPGLPPLVAHVIHRLDVGGMENGLVNLINRMPDRAYRHAVICMKDYTDFARRIRRDDVSLHALGKREGKDLAVHGRLFRLLRSLRPDIVHTRNLATLEAQVTAACAGVRARVHGEHGWDVGDIDGARSRNRLLRKVVNPLVGHYVALSIHQRDYLRSVVHVKPERISHVSNGVDTGRFRPHDDDRSRIDLPREFAPPGTVVVGTVMRMQAVKAPLDLVGAFLRLRETGPALFPHLRLVMAGDGPLREDAARLLADGDAAAQAWLPGAQEDIPALLRAIDVFVMPSLAEGICNTILEAMATGLPVIATRVGGNPDLVVEGETGTLVPPANPGAMASAIAAYASDFARRRQEGAAARARACRHFSLDAMVGGYLGVYDRVLGRGRL